MEKCLEKLKVEYGKFNATKKTTADLSEDDSRITRRIGLRSGQKGQKCYDGKADKVGVS